MRVVWGDAEILDLLPQPGDGLTSGIEPGPRERHDDAGRLAIRSDQAAHQTVNRRVTGQGQRRLCEAIEQTAAADCRLKPVRAVDSSGGRSFAKASGQLGEFR
jgi:hypothetical protein